MALDDYKKYHGFALAELLDNAVELEQYRFGSFKIERIASSVNYLYMVNDLHCFYFKFSTKTDSPWRFTFTEEQLHGIQVAKRESTTLHLVLICEFECIAVLDFQQIEEVINLTEKSNQWISVKSFHNRSLRVAGSKQKLGHTISKSKPFRGFLESISKSF